MRATRRAASSGAKAAESGAKARWWHALHGTTVLLGTGVLGVFSASVVLATMLGDASVAELADAECNVSLLDAVG